MKNIAADCAPSDHAMELELRDLLEGFDALHQRTLGQLDRTDEALDRALAYFSDKRDRHK